MKTPSLPPPPPARPAASMRPAPALAADDAAFLEALQRAGLVAELVGEELARAAQMALDAALDVLKMTSPGL